MPLIKVHKVYHLINRTGEHLPVQLMIGGSAELSAKAFYGMLPGVECKHVAYVAAGAGAPEHELEDVFRKTNHINENWTLGADVMPPTGGWPRCRSTSVGDVVELNDGTKWAVMGFGFEPLPARESLAA